MSAGVFIVGAAVPSDAFARTNTSSVYHRPNFEGSAKERRGGGEDFMVVGEWGGGPEQILGLKFLNTQPSAEVMELNHGI